MKGKVLLRYNRETVSGHHCGADQGNANETGNSEKEADKWVGYIKIFLLPSSHCFSISVLEIFLLKVIGAQRWEKLSGSLLSIHYVFLFLGLSWMAACNRK